MTEPTTATDARGYSWPPAAPGNQLALKHGAYSRPLVDTRASEMLRPILEPAEGEPAPAWLADVDHAALRAWAVAEARCELLREWLLTRPVLREDGTPWPASDELLRWERKAEQARDRLGFNPLARSKIGRDTAAGAVDRALLDARLNEAIARGQQTDAGRTIDGALDRGGAS